MNNLNLAHPNLEQLSAFGQGRLSEAELTELAAHLESCAACRNKVEAAGDDTLISLLRAADTAHEREAEDPRQAATLAGTVQTSPGTDLPAELAAHGRYRLQELLGVGGMGAVYRAEHLLLERPVALKLISQSLTSNPAMIERFRREVKTAGQLRHPNIVLAFDAEQAGDSHFLVMEYVEGKSLARLVQEQGALPVEQACEYICQAALGLQHAHERGMVHRDIKPQNLMRTPDGQVKILDFGLARFAMEAAPTGALLTGAPAETLPTASGGQAPSPSLTQTGTVMGTPDYIAPEQAIDAHTADIRADIYSLGCTLYDLLAGHTPFPEGTVLDKVMAHMERSPRPLAHVRKDVPPELTRVVERMMAKDPAQRYRTPAEVAAALEPFARPTKTMARWRLSIRQKLAVLAASLAGLLLAGIIYIATDNGRLRIEGRLDNVQVVVTKGGKEVRVIDLKSNSEVKLASGEYAVTLRGDNTYVKLSKQAVTITRGREEVVTLSLLPPKDRVDVDHLAAGRTVLGYRLVDCRDVHGFFGPVWEAKAPGGGRATIRIAGSLDNQALQLQLRCLKLFQNLQHRALAPVHSFWLIDKNGWVIDPELLDQENAPRPRGLIVATESFSKTLADRLRECRAAGETGIPPAELFGYMHQAAGALDYLNARGHRLEGSDQAVSIQHRDIKPINLVLTEDHVLKLANTGLFMILQGEKASIPADSLAMTPAFAPPEFFRSTITNRSDQYSLAITYVMLGTGRTPVDGLKLEEVTRIKTQGQLDLSLLPSEAERAIIARATARDAAKRFATCLEMVEALAMARKVSLPSDSSNRDSLGNRAAQQEKERMQGTWRAIAATIQGAQMPDLVLQAIGPTVTFRGDKVTWKATPTPEAKQLFGERLSQFHPEGVFHLDASKSPKTIDFTVLGPGTRTPLGTPVPRALLGIYRLDGERLEFCIAIDPEHAAERPKQFDSKGGKFLAHVVLKRALEVP
jgi:uncharacterized protein (TIGR03067 family)